MSKNIPLKGVYGRGKFAIVSNKDYDKVCVYSCYMTKNGYVHIKIGKNKE